MCVCVGGGGVVHMHVFPRCIFFYSLPQFAAGKNSNHSICMTKKSGDPLQY